MTDRVIIPLPGIGTLELSKEVYESALRPLSGTSQSDPVGGSATARLLSAEDMEEATGVPASWFATQARERRIPFRKLGRYVRFAFEEVSDCEAFKRRAIPTGQLNCTGSQNRKGHANA